MPHLTFALSTDGMVVPAVIAMSHPGAKAVLQAGQPVPNAVRVRALIDTGTDVTAIHADIGRQLGLVPVRSAATQTAGGSVSVSLYRVSLIIPGAAGLAGHSFVHPDLLVTELAVGLPDIDVLLGMDVLADCLLIVDGPGKQFTLAF